MTLRIIEMSVRNREYLALIAPEAVLVDGFDDCIIGVGYRGGSGSSVIVYDRNQIVDKLAKRDGMSCEEADEYFDYNIAGAYLGNNTPIFAETDWTNHNGV